MAIPRFIHQTAPSFEAMPSEFQDNIARIRAANPAWEYKFYDDSAMRQYLRAHLERADWRICEAVAPGYGVVLADLFRYLLVLNEGGVYLDVKAGISRPLDRIVRDDDVCLLSQWRNRVGERYQGWGILLELSEIPGGEFQQWHVIAAPGHPFLERAVETCLRNMRDYTVRHFGTGKRAVVRVSGPICYTRAISPLLSRYRHRFVDIEAEGIHYSIYRNPVGHMAPADHYSRRTEPLMALPPEVGDSPFAWNAGPAG